MKLALALFVLLASCASPDTDDSTAALSRDGGIDIKPPQAWPFQ